MNRRRRSSHAGTVVGLVLVTMVGVARAQPAAGLAPPRTALGVRLGIGFATLDGLEIRGDDPDPVVTSVDGRIAVAVGGAAIVWLGPVGLHGEVMLARKGASFEVVDPGPVAIPVHGSVDLTYLELGLFGRVQPSRTGRLRPFALVGPAFAFKLASSATVEGESMEAFDFTATDLAVVIGAGLGFGPARRGFTAEVRYAAGLRDVADRPAGAPDVRNRVLLLLAGFEI